MTRRARRRLLLAVALGAVVIAGLTIAVGASANRGWRGQALGVALVALFGVGQMLTSRRDRKAALPPPP